MIPEDVEWVEVGILATDSVVFMISDQFLGIPASEAFPKIPGRQCGEFDPGERGGDKASAMVRHSSSRGNERAGAGLPAREYQ